MRGLLQDGKSLCFAWPVLEKRNRTAILLREQREWSRTMKRYASWDEKAVVQIIFNTGDSQCYAVAPDNFDPYWLARLRESLPKVPEHWGWEIVLTEPPAVRGAIEFHMRLRNAAVSQNMVIPAGTVVVLRTSRLAPAERLSHEEMGTLTDLEPCAAVVFSTPQPKS